ncbi:MAG TPA: aminotransferase class IV, partial [Holophagaceae bacterium]
MLEFVTETRVDLARSGARFGEGCFETLRIQDGTPRWLNFHHDRLAEGCARVGLEPPPSLEALREGLVPLCAGRARGVLRILAVDRRLIAWADEAPPEPGAPVRVGLSRRVTRWSGNPWLRVKTLAQLDNRCLQQEAASRGLAEVVAANERGRLTDGGRFNLVALVGGRLVTPPTAEGALPGIA